MVHDIEARAAPQMLGHDEPQSFHTWPPHSECNAHPAPERCSSRRDDDDDDDDAGAPSSSAHRTSDNRSGAIRVDEAVLGWLLWPQKTE
jgi:hypothetical protein